MLIVKKSGKRTLDLFFDEDGAKAMMAVLCQLEAKSMEAALVEVSFGDPSDASNQYSGQLILSRCKESSRIELHQSRIEMEICGNLVRLAEDMLDEFLRLGYLFPAEYTSLSTGKRENIDLYFHSLSTPQSVSYGNDDNEKTV